MATLLRVPHTNCRISQESVGDVAAREISRLTKRPRQLSPLVRSTWSGPRAITSYSLRRTRQTIFGRFFRFGLWPKFPGDIERPRERKSSRESRSNPWISSNLQYSQLWPGFRSYYKTSCVASNLHQDQFDLARSDELHKSLNGKLYPPEIHGGRNTMDNLTSEYLFASYLLSLTSNASYHCSAFS